MIIKLLTKPKTKSSSFEMAFTWISNDFCMDRIVRTPQELEAMKITSNFSLEEIYKQVGLKKRNLSRFDCG